MALKTIHLTGNTYYYAFASLSIPFYKLSDTQLILLDSGFPRTGRILAHEFDRKGIHVEAIIHSHVHPDHIGGDRVLLRRDHPKIYLHSKALKDFMDSNARRTKNTRYDIETDQSSDLATDEELAAEVLRIDGLDHVDVCGRRFGLISCIGHMPHHRLVVTPDQVCYVGDALMYGRTLDTAKTPYTYDLEKDVENKRGLACLPYEHYIAAHEGDFDRSEMQSVIDANLAIFDNLLANVAIIEEQQSSPELNDTIVRLLRRIGLPGHENVTWICETIREYFNYYNKYHTNHLL